MRGKNNNKPKTECMGRESEKAEERRIERGCEQDSARVCVRVYARIYVEWRKYRGYQ